jgi:hypothetical protein
VTSLLADPTIRNSVMSFSPSGKYFPSLSSDAFVGLKADFVSTQSGTYISITNDILRENIAHVWLNLDPSRTSVLSCPSSSVESIEDCTIPLDRASITLKSTRDTVVVPSGNGVALYAGSDRLFRIDASGFIEKSPGITLDLDGANAGNYLGVRIMANDSLLGYLGYRFLESDDGVIRSVRSKDLHDALSANKSQLVFELLSSRYETSYAYVGQSSARTKGITLSLIDESTANRYDPLLAGPQHINGFEQYSREAGIGFGESNKTLLEMAAGNTLGNATKYNTSYLTVTLGDPVFDLPRIEKQRDYDRSIGQRIYRGDAASIESYVPMNFNGDSRQDVAVFLDNGNVDLLANYGGSFRSMGSIISVADAGK